MPVEISLLFLPPATSSVHSSSGFFISPGGNKTHRFLFCFGFIPAFIYSVSPSDFHSRARDTHTRSVHKHTYIYMYSKAQALTSRWDSLLREETGGSQGLQPALEYKLEQADSNGFKGKNAPQHGSKGCGGRVCQQAHDNSGGKALLALSKCDLSPCHKYGHFVPCGQHSFRHCCQETGQVRV